LDISQIAHAGGEVARGSMFGNLHMALEPVRIEKHEQPGEFYFGTSEESSSGIDSGHPQSRINELMPWAYQPEPSAVA
jgi:hypothetical protein